MGGDGIHIALAEHQEYQVPLLNGNHLPQLWQCLMVASEHLLRLGGRLHRNDLVLQVLQAVNIAVHVDSDNLMTPHIGAAPPVFLLPAIHREAAPDAVNGPAFQQGLLLFPIDDPEFRLVAHPPEGLFPQLHIDAGHIAVPIHIAEGRKIIAADSDLCLFFGGPSIICTISAAGQQPGCQAGPAQQRAPYLNIAFLSSHRQISKPMLNPMIPAVTEDGAIAYWTSSRLSVCR